MHRCLILSGLFSTFPVYANAQNFSNKAIVFFSADNGVTWENRSDGLPEELFLTDLAIAHNAVVVSTKRHGIYFFNFSSKQWVPAPSSV